MREHIHRTGMVSLESVLGLFSAPERRLEYAHSEQKTIELNKNIVNQVMLTLSQEK
jgi:hypothetical protein